MAADEHPGANLSPRTAAILDRLDTGATIATVAAEFGATRAEIKNLAHRNGGLCIDAKTDPFARATSASTEALVAAIARSGGRFA